MRNKMSISLVGVLFINCFAYALDGMPKSGELQLQSINRGTSMDKYNDDYTHGTVTGVTFNAAGAGLLHMSKTNCSYSVFTHKEINKISGFCAHEDKNGDKLFY
ncbi:MAG: hypothetical protein IPK77_08085 [Cellvibrio sp.]|nr:hypothetical protein [Cellvibrio sp.]